MYSWVTDPMARSGSHIEADTFSHRVGSRYRYALVSAPTRPGAVSSSGM